MHIASYMTPDDVVADLKANGKKQVLHELARRAASRFSIDETDVFEVLLERERLGTTGFGDGVALPHGKLAGLKEMHMLFARLANGIDYNAVDGRPVDLVFLLLTPEDAGADHLKALAKISRLLRDETVCAKIRGAENAEAVYSALLESDEE